jgi:putative addiction module killer protein
VYYARTGDWIILLLIGGDKRKQQADIERAKEYWHHYEKTTKEGKRSH